jgi:hypothetical protein
VGETEEILILGIDDAGVRESIQPESPEIPAPEAASEIGKAETEERCMTLRCTTPRLTPCPA